MEAVSRFMTSFSSKIEEPVREHLTFVYGSLTLSSVLAAIGAYIHIYTNLFSAGLLSFFAGLACLIALYSTPHSEKNTTRRLGFLLGFAFCSGLGMGPLIEYSIMLDPSIVVSALVCTTFIFASFSLSALFAKRGTFLMLAAPLGTLVTTLLGLSIANLFFGSRLLFQANLYLGLLAMCGFVLFDTSIIIEKRRMGDKDFIAHSIDLFIDFIGIFKRILIILTQKEENERRRRRD